MGYLVKFGNQNRARYRLDWRLDVVINEDQDRTRMGHGPENLAILRPMPINTIKKRGLQRIAARKVQKRQLERERPLPALDAILYSDSLGNRPEFSPHRTKASSRRGRKSDARGSPGPAATGKNLKRPAHRPSPPDRNRSPVCRGVFPEARLLERFSRATVSRTTDRGCNPISEIPVYRGKLHNTEIGGTKN